MARARERHVMTTTAGFLLLLYSHHFHNTVFVHSWDRPGSRRALKDVPYMCNTLAKFLTHNAMLVGDALAELQLWVMSKTADLHKPAEARYSMLASSCLCTYDCCKNLDPRSLHSSSPYFNSILYCIIELYKILVSRGRPSRLTITIITVCTSTPVANGDERTTPLLECAKLGPNHFTGYPDRDSCAE